MVPFFADLLRVLLSYLFLLIFKPISERRLSLIHMFSELDIGDKISLPLPLFTTILRIKAVGHLGYLPSDSWVV